MSQQRSTLTSLLLIISIILLHFPAAAGSHTSGPLTKAEHSNNDLSNTNTVLILAQTVLGGGWSTIMTLVDPVVDAYQTYRYTASFDLFSIRTTDNFQTFLRTVEQQDWVPLIQETRELACVIGTSVVLALLMVLLIVLAWKQAAKLLRALCMLMLVFVAVRCIDVWKTWGQASSRILLADPGPEAMLGIDGGHWS
jgi:hypothetical protein